MYLPLKVLKYTCNNFIFLFTAHDLAGGDQGGFNDPYVRPILIPAVYSSETHGVIHARNHNPFSDEHFKFFNEHFNIPVSHEDLQDKILVLQVISF
jgi:hypothetical protein